MIYPEVQRCVWCFQPPACVLCAAVSPATLNFLKDMTDACPPARMPSPKGLLLILFLKAATSVFQNVFSNPYHEEQHRRGTTFLCWIPKVKDNLRLDLTQVIVTPKVMPSFHLCQPFIAVGALFLCRTRNFFHNCLAS